MEPERERVLVEGLVAGLIGFAVVAVAVAVANVVQGESPFHTADLLGRALFYGGSDPSPGGPAPGPILAYNGLHLAVFLVVGEVAAVLFLEAERHPLLVYPIFFLVLAFMIYTYLLTVAVSDPLGSAFPWWLVGTANVLAAAAMGAYLWRAHPRLRDELRRYDEIDAEAAGER